MHRSQWGPFQGWNEFQRHQAAFPDRGLDEAPAGSIYECGSAHRPFTYRRGSFTSSGKIDMWTGISRRDYPRVWITLELIDEDESPSGHTVMDSS